jgi:hypothetical protein
MTMLDPHELNQIGQIVREIVIEEIGKFRKEMLEKIDETKAELRAEMFLQNLELKREFRSEFRVVKRSIRRLENKLEIAIRTFDNEYLFLKKRIDRIDDHLGFTRLIIQDA